MRHLWHNRKPSAFSLVELLVVIAIIALLAALLLPAMNRGKARAKRIECIGDLNQLGTAFQMFAHDHRGRFPAQTPIADGGSMEFVQAGENINGVFYFSYRNFQPLASELVQTKPLLCPADTGRLPADNFGLLQNSNISYFVGVDASYDQPLSILAGDRNITNDTHATASLVQGAYGLRWTSELHFFQGNVLFSDAHVQEMNNESVDLPGKSTASANYFLPAVRVASATGPGGPAGSTPPAPPPGNPGEPSPSAPGVSGGPYTSPPPAPAVANSSNPAAPASPTPPPSMVSRGAGSRMEGRGAPMDQFTQPDAKEKNAVAVTNGAPPAAAPAADDEAEPPLVWLMGAARGLMARTSWWLLLLILLLLALTLYFYAKRKMRERQQRKGGI